MFRGHLDPPGRRGLTGEDGSGQQQGEYMVEVELLEIKLFPSCSGLGFVEFFHVHTLLQASHKVETSYINFTELANGAQRLSNMCEITQLLNSGGEI